MMGRTSARTVMVLLGVTGALVALLACGDSKPPTGSGNVLIDDSHHSGDELPPPPPTDPSDALPDMVYGDVPSDYAPLLDTCAACTCDPSAYYCFAGGVAAARATAEAGDDAGDDGGAGDGAAAACPIVSGSKTQVGCNVLPPACAANPTCVCVIQAIQSQFSCYLVCSPDPGYLRVYCPNP